jgi:acetyltransferase
LHLSQLSVDFEEIDEIEINPLLVLPEGQGALALDGRVILR